MTAANDPLAWQNFYVMIGTANAAITGLLFVALSLHLSQILKHPTFKPGAVVALVVLVLQIVIASIVLAPQPRLVMGLEIILLNVGFIAYNLRTRWQARISAGAAVTLGIRAVYLYAALSLIFGIGGGFYVLGAILLVTMGRSVASCWVLLTRLESGTESE